MLSEQYTVEPVDLKTTGAIDPLIGTLIILAPKSPFTEGEKYKLDQYIMNGGNVAFLIDKIVPNFPQQQMVMGNPVTTNLDDMLGSYGIAIRTDLIRDLQSSSVQVRSAIGFPISMNYPFFPAITNICERQSCVRETSRV